MRLIDADALKMEFPKDEDWNYPVNTNSFVCELIDAQPTVKPERKKGRWIDKNVMYKDEANNAIEEWQSAKCSVCGKYHTTPYLYYFDNFCFCPHCGADMRGEEG